MPEARVGVAAGNGRGERVLTIRVNGPNPTFRLAADRIEAKLCRPVEPVMLDLLDIAATVFSADSTISRGSDTRSRFGAAWRREFAFRMPVRCPEVWNRPEVGAALREAVEFLTDDVVSFEFGAATGWPMVQEYLDLEEGSSATADEVVLFSGGLDSFAGALETLATGTGRAVLVTHRSSQKMFRRQTRLAGELAKRFPGRVIHIPVLATRVGQEASETTQRSRSLLFAALGYVTAATLGATRIAFYENGVVSHNLPISAQVIGTMATRTTHPLSLRLLGDLLNLLGPTPIRIENRYEWLTKKEVVQKIAAHDAADLIRDTVSCTSIRSQSILHTHCGACAQCLDRRFAMLASGLEESDPAEIYETEVLLGARETDRSRIMAPDWTAHACRLAELSLEEFASTWTNELSRIIAGHPGERSLETLRRSHDLQCRHGRAVKLVLEGVLAASAGPLLDRQIPPTALLSSNVVRTAGGSLPQVTLSPVQAAGLPDVADPELVPDLFPLQVTFEHVDQRPWVRVAGLGEVVGEAASVPHVLKKPHLDDRASGLSRDAATYIPSGTVAGQLGRTKNAIRQRVRRCHVQLAEFYQVVMDEPPSRPLLIESSPPKGYRLDPDCRIVAGETDHRDGLRESS